VFTVRDASGPVNGAIAYLDARVSFDPNDNLLPGVVYTATITTDATDLAGNELSEDYTWDFTVSPGLDVTAPTVASTSPADGAMIVPIGSTVQVVFSEQIDPLTLTPERFGLTGPGGNDIAGTSVYDVASTTVTFTPDADLDLETTYEAHVDVGVADLAGNSLAADYVWTFQTHGVLDLDPPVVVVTFPTDGANDVAVDVSISAVFSEPLDAGSVDASTFYVTGPGGAPVAGALSVDPANPIATFVPAVDLQLDATYTATLTTGVTDLAGNALAADYVWTFTVPLDLDVTAPEVVVTYPDDLATDVPLQASMHASFSEPMDPATLTTATFRVSVVGVGTAIPGVVFYDATSPIATFVPNDPFVIGTSYLAAVTTGAQDLAGLPLTADHVWTFSTVSADDVTAPAVTFTNPARDATGVVIEATVHAAFSEAMDVSSLDTSSFRIIGPGGLPIAGDVRYDVLSPIASFVPAADLEIDALYTAQITTGATDLAGNPLASDYTWTFTTASDVDVIPPTVTFANPADGSTGVALETNLHVAFSEAMDATTVTAATFRLTGPGAVSIPGAVFYDVLNPIATFSPVGALAPNTTYTARITTGVEDLAGNALVGPFVWTFTTANDADLIPPLVSFTNPGGGATGVAVDANVNAVFNEGMDPSSLNESTFRLLRSGGTQVIGSVAYDPISSVASFVPAGDLDAGETYTARLTTTVSDSAGNDLATPYVWTFTTLSDADQTPPMVTLTNPADGAVDVPLDATVSAAFSEPMDETTVSLATFRLVGPGANDVAGTVHYDDSVNPVASFVPSNDLLEDTSYTATLSTGTEDLAGNALILPVSWTFTTARITPLGPLDLGSLESFVALAGAGLLNSNPTVDTSLGGDVGLHPSGACVSDLAPCTPIDPDIQGALYANDVGGVAAMAQGDLADAIAEANARTTVMAVEALDGLALHAGVYTSFSSMNLVAGGTLVLDGQSDPNAVWVFKVGSTLTFGDDAQVLLIGGARADNVFWVTHSASLGEGVDLYGSVLANDSISSGNDTIVVGRLLCGTGQLSLESTTVTLPPL
jgi:methionine-rich copper-binding protein CopC